MYRLFPRPPPPKKNTIGGLTASIAFKIVGLYHKSTKIVCETHYTCVSKINIKLSDCQTVLIGVTVKLVFSSQYLSQ